MKILYFLFLTFIFPSLTFAQFPSTDDVLDEKKSIPVQNDKKVDYDTDVSSVDNILHALYDVISGPQDDQIDLKRWHNLFAEGAILAPTGKSPQSGLQRIQILSAKQYMDYWNGGLRPEPFYEIETARTSDNFGAVTQVFSTYESRRHPSEAKPFDRGINSIQLMNDGDRWWVVSVFWDRERADLPIPSRYGG